MKIVDVISKYEKSLLSVTNVPILELKWYICYVTKIKIEKFALYIYEDVDNETLETIKSFVSRRLTGEPFAYIVKNKEFMGLNFYVDNRVLIPRPDTEILVESIIKSFSKSEKLNGYEVGIGSGIISISLLKNMPFLIMDAVDISTNALEIAKKNKKIHNLENRLFLNKADISLKEMRKYDFVVSNPPYISKKEYDDLDIGVKNYEPITALVADNLGYEYYYKISKKLYNNIKIGGKIFYEIGCNQAKIVTKILDSLSYKDIKVIKDYANKDRVIIAEKR